MKAVKKIYFNSTTMFFNNPFFNVSPSLKSIASTKKKIVLNYSYFNIALSCYKKKAALQ